jgi:hypothetical protein
MLAVVTWTRNPSSKPAKACASPGGDPGGRQCATVLRLHRTRAHSPALLCPRRHWRALRIMVAGCSLAWVWLGSLARQRAALVSLFPLRALSHPGPVRWPARALAGCHCMCCVAATPTPRSPSPRRYACPPSRRLARHTPDVCCLASHRAAQRPACAARDVCRDAACAFQPECSLLHSCTRRHPVERALGR